MSLVNISIVCNIWVKSRLCIKAITRLCMLYLCMTGHRSRYVSVGFCHRVWRRQDWSFVAFLLSLIHCCTSIKARQGSLHTHVINATALPRISSYILVVNESSILRVCDTRRQSWLYFVLFCSRLVRGNNWFTRDPLRGR